MTSCRQKLIPGISQDLCLNINLIDYAILNIYEKSTVMITEVLIYTEGKREFLYEETRQKFCLKELYKDHN